MTIKTTTWSPDTCNCTLRYKWDDTDPQADVQIDVVNKSCQYHSNLLPNIPVTFSCIMDENRKKNNTLQYALETAPSKLADQFTDENGTISLQIKNGIAFNYRFDGTAPNRVLYISFLGASLTNNEKNSLQSKLNQKFGNGIVIIE